MLGGTARLAVFTHVPSTTMIYTIKLTYCFKVEATDRVNAYRRAVQVIREEPGSFISGVMEGEYLRQRPVWKRLLFGW